MKKLLLGFVLVLWSFFTVSFGIDTFSDAKENTYTSDRSDVVRDMDDWEFIREWQYRVGSEVDWIDNPQIDDSDKAQEETLEYVENVVNYFLGLVWFIALIYLLYHGFLMVTSAGEDDRYKKWWQWVKYWLIAVIWIGISWLIVSLIIYLVWL